MSDELFYTSAPRGLRPGTSGFCTVAATATLGPAWIARLEAISGYKPRYPVGDPRADDNPIAYAHVRLAVAGQTRSVLTRAAAAGADHTGRSNVFVHHVLPADRERGPAGPAWTMRQSGVMNECCSDSEPRTLGSGRALPMGRPGAAPATAWQRETGDAAWAAAIAGPALEDPASIVYLIYPPGTDVLALFDEAIRLLPEPQRWLVTFNTYVTEAHAAGTTCAWRGVMAGTPAVALARGLVIDLTNLDPSRVPTGPYAEAARTGRPADVARPYFHNSAESLSYSANTRELLDRPLPLRAREPDIAVAPRTAAQRPGADGLRADIPRRGEDRDQKRWVLPLAVSAGVLAVAIAASIGLLLLREPPAVAGTASTAAIAGRAAEPVATTVPTTQETSSRSAAATGMSSTQKSKDDAAREAEDPSAPVSTPSDVAGRSREGPARSPATKAAEPDSSDSSPSPFDAAQSGGTQGATGSTTQPASGTRPATAPTATSLPVTKEESATQPTTVPSLGADTANPNPTSVPSAVDDAGQAKSSEELPRLERSEGQSVPFKWDVAERPKLELKDASGKLTIMKVTNANSMGWDVPKIPVDGASELRIVHKSLIAGDVQDAVQMQNLAFQLRVEGSTIFCNFDAEFAAFETAFAGTGTSRKPSLQDLGMKAIRNVREKQFEGIKISVTESGKSGVRVLELIYTERPSPDIGHIRGNLR